MRREVSRGSRMTVSEEDLAWDMIDFSDGNGTLPGKWASILLDAAAAPGVPDYFRGIQG